MRSRWIVIALMAVLLAACAGEPGLGGNGGNGGERIETTGELSILEPQPSAVFVDGEPIPVALSLEGAVVVDESSTTVTPDTGHIHVTLNGTLLSLFSGLEFELGELSPDPIGPGLHLLQVEFVAADHGVFAPREIKTVTFTVNAASSQ